MLVCHILDLQAQSLVTVGHKQVATAKGNCPNKRCFPTLECWCQIAHCFLKQQCASTDSFALAALIWRGRRQILPHQRTLNHCRCCLQNLSICNIHRYARNDDIGVKSLPVQGWDQWKRTFLQRICRVRPKASHISSSSSSLQNDDS